MKTIEVQVPEEESEGEIKMAMAAILVENVGSFGVSLFDEDGLHQLPLSIGK